MKSTCPKLRYVVPLLALGCVGYLPGAEALPAKSKSVPVVPQGLPRLAGLPAVRERGRIPAEAVSIVDVASPQAAGAVGRVASQGRVRFLALPPETEWSVLLRPRSAGVGYVTFTLQASLGSVVSVDGAQVSLVKSTEPDYATVMVGYPKGEGIEWISLQHDVELRPYSGQLMGTLAMVTICADTEAGHWSITLGDRLAAHDLPLGLPEPGVRRTFTVKTGAAGAWISGVATSDENPVFADANHNGVRDSFEQKLLGAPLARQASRETRERLIKVWKERSYIAPSDYAVMIQNGAGEADWENIPAEFHLEIPVFDRTPEPETRRVHGVPSSVIFR
jgi:hypothetical protein